MNSIKHWFMKHFYQDIYNLYRMLDAQTEINDLLMKRVEDLNQRLAEMEKKSICQK
jgi:hypothetical protein